MAANSKKHDNDIQIAAGVAPTHTVGIQFNSECTGLTFSASAHKGWGRGDGTDTTWANSQVLAGQQLSITSGLDTTLQGAVAQGQQVVVNTGGQLSLQSLQDTSTYDSKSTRMGAGLTVCVPPLCKGTSSVNASHGQTRIDSTFTSVGQRTAIEAGDQGFQVNVAGSTELIGAVVASTDKAVQDGANQFNTQGLSTQDLLNEAACKAQVLNHEQN
ncbi:hypothetical protein EYS42_16575 [Aquabacterium lacunae]|uniref:Uncharacterized protein n=1 Tax=Aquabacterium lacunae TaxID=2528630 RepID=A0A4Q9GUN4_9BURK|nr:hypothetical protein EYS42_16575 [Aquabacterium lacunae]